MLYRERTTGFEPATLTLAKKEPHLLRQDRRTPPSILSPVSSSAQSAESARLQRFTFNALNLCEIADPSDGRPPRFSVRRTHAVLGDSSDAGAAFLVADVTRVGSERASDIGRFGGHAAAR